MVKHFEKKFRYTKPGTFFILVPNGRLLSSAGACISLSETGVVGRKFSLSSYSSRRVGFLDGRRISKSSNTVAEQRVSLPDLKTMYTSS